MYRRSNVLNQRNFEDIRKEKNQQNERKNNKQGLRTHDMRKLDVRNSLSLNNEPPYLHIGISSIFDYFSNRFTGTLVWTTLKSIG